MLTTSNLVLRKQGRGGARADQRPVTDNGTNVPERQTLTTMTAENENENDSDSNERVI